MIVTWLRLMESMIKSVTSRPKSPKNSSSGAPSILASGLSTKQSKSRNLQNLSNNRMMQTQHLSNLTLMSSKKWSSLHLKLSFPEPLVCWDVNLLLSRDLTCKWSMQSSRLTSPRRSSFVKAQNFQQRRMEHFTPNLTSLASSYTTAKAKMKLLDPLTEMFPPAA